MKSLKKNLNTKIKLNPEIEILFFDESRFGTHSKLGYGWFKRGTRPQVKINLGFNNFYVYSAVNSINGYNLSLILPYVDTQCMNIFLQKLSEEMSGKKCILVLDGASWHRSNSLIIPENIEFIYLPSYSPELNPVERLWNYLKQNTIKNRFYESIKILEDVVCSFLKGVGCDTIKSVCSCDYMGNYI